jgi:hypothetical protein
MVAYVMIMTALQNIIFGDTRPRKNFVVGKFGNGPLALLLDPFLGQPLAAQAITIQKPVICLIHPFHKPP